jgi:hypothetical protein
VKPARRTIITDDGYVIKIPLRPRRLLHREALQLIVEGRGEVTHRYGPRLKIMRQPRAEQFRGKGWSRWTQKQLIELIDDAQRRFGGWHGYSSRRGDPVSHQEFADAYEDYEGAITRAIRAGLIDHKIVAAWIRARRSVGDYEALRTLRLGLEVGMPDSLDEEDFWIAMEAAGPLEDGQSLPEVQRALQDNAEKAEASLRPALRSRLRSTRNLRRRLASMGIYARR